MFGKHKDLFITLTLILSTAVLLFVNLGNIGVCWDEANYIGWSIRYNEWISLVLLSLFKGGLPEMFSEQAISYFWVGSSQHPPLVMLLGACSLGILRKVIGLLNSVRLVSLVSFSILIGLTFRFGLSWDNRRVGLFSALFLFFMPHMFGHGLIYSLDMPMALAWFAATFCFVKGLKYGRWGLLTGFFLGLALLTKINALLLPVIFSGWVLIVFILKSGRKGQMKFLRFLGCPFIKRGEVKQRIKQAGQDASQNCQPFYNYKHNYRYNFLSIFLITPAVVFCLWPRLWHHPLVRIQAYLSTKLERMVIPVYYLGRQWTQTSPPWHYPLIMIIFTVSPIVLILFIMGLVNCLKNTRKDEIGLLIALSFGLQLVVTCLPNVPRYDGVRLFLSIFPFVALLAGLGADWLWVKLIPPDSKLGKGAGIVVLCVFFMMIALPLFQIRPFYLAYYNGLAGGPAGANRLGMETTYWGDTCNDNILGYLKNNLPAGAKVCIYPAGENMVNVWKILGIIRPDLKIDSDYQNSNYDYLVLNCRQGFFDEKLWDIYKNKRPVFGNYYRGLPLTVVYKF